MKRTTLIKKMKRTLCLMLCLIMVFSLAGCGCGKNKSASKNKTETTKDTDENQDTTKKQDSSDDPETEKNADAADTDTTKKGGAVDTNIDGNAGSSTNGSSGVVSANTMEVASETRKTGEEFVVTIEAGENTPVAAYTIELSYDATKLQVVEFGRTETFKEAYTGMCAENDKGGIVIFAGANMNENQQYFTGDMLYVKFKAIGEAGSVSDLKLNVKEAVPFDGGNTAGKFTVKSGTVTIE